MKYMTTLSLSIMLLALFSFGCGKSSAGNANAGKGTMTLQAIPEDVKINIQGKDVGVTPRTTNPVRPGMYVVKFEKDGYYPEWRAVTVEAGRDTLEEVRLRPITSVAVITSTPAGAKVIKDGRDMGITPCVLTGLAWGRHSARLQMPGCLPQEINWEVNTDRPFSSHTDLVRNTGIVMIESELADATIVIDGKPRGMTPFRDELEQGMHEIRVEKNGYKPYVTNIEVERKGSYSLKATMELLPIPLVITSKPSGAVVKVNGKEYGVTPYTFQTTKPGKYKVFVSKEKYGNEEREITMAPGNNYNMDLTLSSEMGSVQFVTEPAGITVYIDGKEVGKTEVDPDNPNISKVFTVNDLEQGEHTLELYHKRAKPDPRRAFKFQVKKLKTFRFKKNLELWIPNVELVHVRGWRRIGRVRDLKQDPIRFEPKKGVSSNYPKKEVKELILLPDEE